MEKMMFFGCGALLRIEFGFEHVVVQADREHKDQRRGDKLDGNSCCDPRERDSRGECLPCGKPWKQQEYAEISEFHEE